MYEAGGIDEWVHDVIGFLPDLQWSFGLV